MVMIVVAKLVRGVTVAVVVVARGEMGRGGGVDSRGGSARNGGGSAGGRGSGTGSRGSSKW